MKKKNLNSKLNLKRFTISNLERIHGGVVSGESKNQCMITAGGGECEIAQSKDHCTSAAIKFGGACPSPTDKLERRDRARR